MTSVRPSQLAFDSSDGVQVDIQFMPRGEDAVVVSITASRLNDVEAFVGATEGFTLVLCKLKHLLESGAAANLVRDKAELLTGKG